MGVVFQTLRFHGAAPATTHAIINDALELPPGYRRANPPARDDDDEEEGEDRLTPAGLVAEAKTRLDRCEAGEPYAWALLLKWLAEGFSGHDWRPTKGSSESPYDGFDELPGYADLPTEVQRRMPDAACGYLERNEPDASRKDGWWQTGRPIDWRAGAGALALGGLVRSHPGDLARLGDGAWETWAPAVVAFPWSSRRGPGSHGRRLLERLLSHAPAAGVAALLHHARLRAERPAPASTIPRELRALVGDARAEALEGLFAPFLEEVEGGLPVGFLDALAALIESEAPLGSRLVDEAYAALERGPARPSELYVSCAATALGTDADRYWPRVRAGLEAAPRSFDAVLARLAKWCAETPDAGWLRSPSLAVAAALCRAVALRPGLAAVLGPDYAGARLGFCMMAVDRVAAHGARAVHALERLAAELPAYAGLVQLRLAELRPAATRPATGAVDPRAVLAMAADRRARLVRDERELLDVVVESLLGFERRLQGSPPIVRALWNDPPSRAAAGRPPGKRTHKGENFLSDMMCEHLNVDLGRRGLIANREVEVRAKQFEDPGQRADIRVDAAMRDPGAKGRHLVATVIIEVKGCWNAGLFDSMGAQLRDRYLRTTGSRTGLYVVGWYVCEAWKEPRVAGRTLATTDTLEHVRERLETTARALSAGRVHVASLVLDARLT